MEKVHFKGCPRCTGDLFLDQDLLEGWIETCIQCGFRRYLNDPADIQLTAQQSEPGSRDEDRVCECSGVKK